MPKEIVPSPTMFNGMHYVNEAGEDQVDETARGLRAEVRWGREQEFVQVATVADGTPDGSYRAIVDELFALLEDPSRDQSGDAEILEGLRERLSLGDGADSHGWFCDLDRRGINELIRHLRRARDQAFGRDE
jgi:hypothetical protein